MEKYISKHPLPDHISVSSLVTAYRDIPLYNRSPHAEAHNFPEMFFVRECSGEHCFLLDGVQRSIKKGQLFIFPPNSVHSLLPHSNATIDIISFETESDISVLYNKKPITLNAKQVHAFLELIHLGSRLFEDIPAPEHKKGMSLHPRASILQLQRFKNNLELFLIDLMLDRSDEPRLSSSGTDITSEEQFDRIVSYMKKNIDMQLSLEDLSKKHSLSVTKIQKLFYKHTGVAPKQYFIDLKLNAAIKMMTNTSMNHAQISEALGFSSPAYFSKLFKKKTGMSPSEYTKAFNPRL